MASTKSELRARLLTERQAKSQNRAADRAIVSQALMYLSDLSPKTVHIFKSLAYQGEIDTAPLFKWALDLHLDLYSTIKIGKSWQLVKFTSPQKYVRADPAEIDVIIVPSLAFDVRLHRLGYGAGYYDRLAEVFPAARLVGLAYDWQRVETLPSEAHDVPMHVVVTETEIYHPAIDKA